MWGRTGFLRPPPSLCFHRRGVAAQLQARGVAVPPPGAYRRKGTYSGSLDGIWNFGPPPGAEGQAAVSRRFSLSVHSLCVQSP